MSDIVWLFGTLFVMMLGIFGLVSLYFIWHCSELGVLWFEAKARHREYRRLQAILNKATPVRETRKPTFIQR